MNYSVSELIKTMYSFLLTKVTMRNANLIRRPLYVRGGSLSSVVGGRGLTTGRFCRFELKGREHTLFIGDDCRIGDMIHIVALNDVKIGSGVLMASKCFISDTNHGNYSGKNSSTPDIPPNYRALVSGSVTIGNNVWIGENVVILNGANIGDGCIIGANSVVSKKIPKNCMVVSNNKIIKKFNTATKRWEKGI